ncbi:MAG TPA: hypothetical protein VJK26_01835 [Patescibacteria group bacterium]|nr:hypothetical protein [Patescibacteria group bacterium]
MHDRFQWFEEGVLAGSEMPEAEDIKFLFDKGIEAIISLEPLSKETEEEIKRRCIAHYTLYLKEGDTPSCRELEEFFEILYHEILLKHPVLIHSRYGKGRTNLMAGLWLIRERNLSFHQVMEKAGPVETGSQENFWRNFSLKHGG